MKSRLLLIFFIIAICSFSAFAQAQAIVITKTAQFRAKPSKTAKVLFTVKKGAKLKIEDELPENGWYRVSVLKGNQKGWMHGNAIKLDDFDVDSVAKSVWSDEYLKTHAEGGWILLYTNPMSKTYFNPLRIRDLGNGLYEYWLKDVITDKGDYINKLTEIDGNGLKYLGLDQPKKSADDLSHILIQENMDCKKRLRGIQVSYIYAVNGDLLKTEPANQPLEPVIPESNGELELAAVCKNHR